MRRRFTSNNSFTESFDIGNYLTIEALEDRLTVSFDNDIEYGIDGRGWQILKAGKKTPYINNGQTLSFRGELTSAILTNGIGTFIISKKCNLLGNCMSMLFKDNAADNYSLESMYGAFTNLFFNCTNIKSVSADFLPATTLAKYCYWYMFYGCNGLTTAPELPATILTSSCYGHMFEGCTSLVNAPELPATTLADSCYSGMFYSCTALTTAPDLPVTKLVGYCYNNMFRDCSKLNYIKMLATDISASNCLNNWVNGVSSTGTFVKNSAMTTLPTATSSNNYAGIPIGWTVVNDGEESGGGKIVNHGVLTIKQSSKKI